MPGLLDLFSPQDPTQQQGLLAAAAKMMEMSGPSLNPRSFGQIAGSAYGAYNGAVQSAQDRQQQQTLMGLKLKDAQSDFDNQEMVRERNKRIMQRLQGLQSPQGLDGTTGAAPGASTGAASGVKPQLGDYDTSYNGTPYTGGDGAEAYRAAERAGMTSYDPNKLNQVMALSRQGMTTGQAAGLVFGGSAQPSQAMASAMPGGPVSPKIGGPDWMQAYQQQNGQQLAAHPAAQAADPSAQAPASTANLTQSLVARLSREAQIRSEEGDLDGANKLLEHAAKFMPEVNKIEVGMNNGTPVNVITFKDGTQRISQFAPKPDIHFADDGQHTAVPINGYTGQSMGPGLVRQATPGEVLQNGQAGARLAFDKSQADSNQDAAMDPLAVRTTAQQYLAGDSSALQNFGRGAQGAANLNAVRLEVAKQANAAGLSGADIAARMAEFGGTKAGMRTAATRSAGIEIAANEVAQLAPLALAASSKVARSGFLPFGKAQVMFDANTNDPNLRQFAMANTALANAYGQAMARGGVASVADKEHAKELLGTAMDQPSYAAAVAQLQQEIKAAQAAPKAVRSELSNSVAGREGSAPAAGSKTVTLSDIAATARASGKTTRQVTADLRAAGYTIGGQ